jgi:ferritin
MKKIGLLGISYNGLKEQIEEKIANYLMDKITLAGENAKGDALYQLDKDLENFR